MAVFLSITILAPPGRGQAQAGSGGLKNLRGIYFDNDGLIIHKKNRPDCPTVEKVECQDGGDTAQREGWYWLGVWIRANTPGLKPWPYTRKLNFDQVLRLLEPKGDGVFYRHPKLAPWNKPYDKELGFSRDQLEPLVAAMGVWGKYAEIGRLWDALPTDLTGKHAFNGNWRNALGQDGMNCSEIEKRGCDATADCPLDEDRRDCSLKTDNTDCSATRACDFLAQVDTRNCEGLGKIFCEAGKAAQNAIYAADAAGKKTDCERIKSQEKIACEASKASKNVGYQAEKDLCETGKASQNAAYAAKKAGCEAAKAGNKGACEAQKAADLGACRLGNIFNGDNIGPMTDNLFKRALNQVPSVSTYASGDTELLTNSYLRRNPAITTEQPDPKGNVGDDLNHIVRLLMALMRSPSAISAEAVNVYKGREHNYGSYFKAYLDHYGDDLTDFDSRLKAGVQSAWPPDPGISGIFGAVRWYHRPSETGNPLLAELYAPIIERFFQ
jgi:hypothetical protein